MDSLMDLHREGNSGVKVWGYWVSCGVAGIG